MTKRSILVVEDELIVALEIKKTLIKLGYAVAGTEKDGQSAIETAGKTNPDLILMDIRLKGDMDGIEAAQRIRALYQTPVIFLTAHSDEDTLSRALRTRPCGYLVKPFRERELYQAIEMGIHKSHVLRKMQPELVASAFAPPHPLEIITVPALLLRDDGNISMVNRAFSSLVGLSPEECSGRTFATVIGLETKVNSFNLPDKMVIRTSNGSRRPVVIKVGFMTTSGRPQPLLTFTSDDAGTATTVSSPVLPEDDSPVDYRRILDDLDLPILVIGDDLRIRYFNRPFGKLLSLVRISQFLLTRPIYEIEKFTLFGSVDDFRDVMGTQDVRTRVRRYRKQGGDVVIRSIYIPMESGGTNVVTTLMYDITAEVNIAEERKVLSQAHTDLQSILNETFRISAEAKNPVTTLERLVHSHQGQPGIRDMGEQALILASVIGQLDSALLRFDGVKRNISAVAGNDDEGIDLTKYTL